MQKQAILIFGTPGSGKGTQANLLMWTQNFIHFDSGRYLRSVLYNPENQSKKLIQKEKMLNEAGKLNTPSWVLGIFKKEVKMVAKSGHSIVYSGSPRTMYEAFGDKKVVGLVPFLEKIYGKKNVHAVFLSIDPAIAAARNKVRRTCTVCQTPVIGDAPITLCTLCQGQLKVRIDDDPEKYKIRYSEYVNRTMPILDELKKRGYKIPEINAAPNPPIVFEQVKRELGI